jgi:hypothetical protein
MYVTHVREKLILLATEISFGTWHRHNHLGFIKPSETWKGPCWRERSERVEFDIINGNEIQRSKGEGKQQI